MIKSSLDYWKIEWTDKRIGFHKNIYHSFLVKHHEKLFNGRNKCKIFFPLCGKAIDMFWFASLGHEIVGVEGVQTAVEEFFTENKLEYTVRDANDFKVYESNDKHIRLYLGDFFKFNNSYEKDFNGVWDRGSLVAIAPEERDRYAEIMLSILATDCVCLLDTIAYDESEYQSTPHNISDQLVHNLFGKKLKIQLLDERVEDLLQKRFNLKNPFKELLYLMNFL